MKIRVTVFDFGPCPQCGRGLQVGCSDDGQPQTISHVQPMCRAFCGMTADKFLLYVLDQREKQRAEA